MSALIVNNVQFVLNGQQHIVPNNVHPATRLSDYIRQMAQLKGTKVMCREGGCGVCVVTVQYHDPITEKEKTRAINSCLCPIYIARGWTITTTEGLGGKHSGFHPIQQRMADHSATQCGYCTPGFVMGMYGLLKRNPSPSVDDVTKAIDGNLCRCTGYRSILDAMTSFSRDGHNANPIDIEEIQNLKCVKKQNCKHSNTPHNAPVIFKNWQRPQTLDNLYDLLEENKEKRNRLVVGNTASGVHKKDRYDMFFDIRALPELYKVNYDESCLEVGASVTLTDLQEIFEKYKDKRGFGYLEKFIDHIDLIGHTTVRNSGCWAGNLMMQHTHPEFLADMLPPLEAIRAKIVIGSKTGEQCVSAQGLMSENMANKVILSVRLPALGELETFSVYKVMLRQQSAHGYVTAAFRAAFVDSMKLVVREASLVFGGLSDDKEHHALNTEDYIQGKALNSDQVKSECLLMLGKDIKVSDIGLSPVEYRTHLAQNLLYKFLSKIGTNGRVPPPARLLRPPVSSSRDYETLPKKYPITQSLPRLTGSLQASGEVVYLDDIPTLANELSALLVISTIAKGNIDTIDTAAALAIPGVVDIVIAKDITGTKVKLLADDAIEYCGQPLAVVLADDLGLAYRAASMVRVTYKNVQKPILELEEAVHKDYIHAELPELRVGDTEAAMKKCKRIVEGSFKHGSQYHFYLENQGCLVSPHEDGFKVWASAQSTDMVQSAIAEALGIMASSVQVTVPRVGGTFGGKAIISTHFGALAALGAAKTNRPVRFNPSLETCMKVTGHRPSLMASYKAGVDEAGMITAMETQIFWNSGHRMDLYNLVIGSDAISHCDAVYHFPNMFARGKIMKTDQQLSSPMRSPGQLPAHLLVDTMMEHVAHELGVDAVFFKHKHLCKQGQMMLCGAVMPTDNIHILWENAMKSADVRARQLAIADFNKGNKWVKRGLAMSVGKFIITYTPTFAYPAYLAVYQHDGSVVISHGGVEFGQGLDTKAAQVAMKILGIPQKLIKFVHTNTLTAPNTMVTGGSQTSELLCRTVQECCESLLAKLQPIREQHPEADWKSLVQKAHMAGVHMAVTGKHVSPTIKTLDYPTLGVLVAEAEVDILTGENQILRADIHMDIGESVNPEIDVGQVEGALVTGLGMMLREREVLNPETGQLLTASTWEYKPPSARDIPADFRVNFLKGKPNKSGVFSSKAVGEPPICTTPAFLHAVRAAVAASRKERGHPEHFYLYAPATPADILRACSLSQQDFVW